MTEDPLEGVDPDEFKKQVISKEPSDKRMQKFLKIKKYLLIRN